MKDNPKNNEKIIQVVQKYLDEHDLYLDPQTVFEWGIDCVGIFIDDKVVLNIGLPPVSDYLVRETEYTDRYLRPRQAIAV